MTPEELRKLDAEVHREVMERACALRGNGTRIELGGMVSAWAAPMDWREEDGRAAPPYSTDIAAAWQVVEKLKLTVTPADPRAGKMRWLADTELKGPFQTWLGWGDTAPLAICRAALAALTPAPARTEDRR